MRLTSILLIAALVAGTYADAQTAGESRREERRASPAEQACKSEIQQYCQGQTGQQAEQCLKNNQSKLSSQCKNALQTPQK
jgi:Ni/Co efflux regulator RcnB